MRPVGPPLLGTSVEAGVAPYGMVSQTSGGAGAMSWAAVQVVPDVDVLARGYGADLFQLDGSTAAFSDVMLGGEVGIRSRKEFFPHMIVGAEAVVGIEQRSGPLAERILSLSVGVPVAEQAFESVWLFTDLSLGLALPLTPDPNGRPFFSCAIVGSYPSSTSA